MNQNDSIIHSSLKKLINIYNNENNLNINEEENLFKKEYFCNEEIYKYNFKNEKQKIRLHKNRLVKT